MKKTQPVHWWLVLSFCLSLILALGADAHSAHSKKKRQIAKISKHIKHGNKRMPTSEPVPVKPMSIMKGDPDQWTAPLPESD